MIHLHRCPRCTPADSMVGQVLCADETCTDHHLRLCEEHR